MIQKQYYLNQELSSAIRQKVKNAYDEIFEDLDSEDVIFTSESHEEIEQVDLLAEKIQKNFTDVVFIGTGASYTIPKMYVDFGRHSDLNFHFLRNIDSKAVRKLKSSLNPSKTIFILISKSGESAEIIINFLSLYEWMLKQVGNEKIKNHFITITEENPSKIFEISSNLGFQNLVHPAVGGRFSVFTSVGMLAAKLVGFDIQKILDSAKNAGLQVIRNKDDLIEGVAFQYAHHKEGFQHVNLSYGESFAGYNEWCDQLILESLGKNNVGLLSSSSIGSYDQHLKLQYYLDGAEKIFLTLLSVVQDPDDLEINNKTKIKNLDYFVTNSFHESLDKNKNIVQHLLTKHNKPIKEIKVAALNEEGIAYLLVEKIMELMVLAKLIGVNPFGQPAVEKIKQNIEKELKRNV